MPFWPLFLGLGAGAFGAACSVYDLPSQEGSGISASGAAGKAVSPTTGTGGDNPGGGPSVVEDANNGSNPVEANTAGSSGSSDAPTITIPDAAADIAVTSDANNGPVLA